MSETLAPGAQPAIGESPRTPYREAVVTIQGGGIFGLSLLGQAQAILEKHQYVPLAFAGTSAGAIVATLLWGGMPPSEIRDEFVRIAESKGGMPQLLGPFSDKPVFQYEHFLKLKKDVVGVGPRLLKEPKGIRAKMARLIMLPDILYRLRSVVRRVRPHIPGCGFFQGEELEKLIERLLRRSPDLPEWMKEKNGPLVFADYARLMTENGDEAYRPPLLLTVTNLTMRRLEVISSIDPNYTNVPIARAVRASAGFPVFFQPLQIRGSPQGGWFVDGGVVSNFPAWVFSDVFRKALEEVDPYRGLAGKPWIHIGLRVTNHPGESRDERDPAILFPSLIAMLANESRNQLEDILASRVRRSIIIQQPTSTTAAPGDALDVEKLDAATTRTMVQRGFEFTDQTMTQLGSPEVFQEVSRENVVGHLRGLVERCLLILQVAQEQAKLRSNVFMPDRETLRLLFSYNMDGPEDRDRHMTFPDQQSGLAGFCYTSRRPHICNLATVRRFRRERPDDYKSLFGMDTEQEELVRPDRTWLACMPIFDPFELRFADPAGRRRAFIDHVRVFHRGESGIDGPVLGVLCLDAGWSYQAMHLDPDPDIHFRDLRIEGTLNLMQASAQSLGGLLAGGFPDSGGVR